MSDAQSASALPASHASSAPGHTERGPTERGPTERGPGWRGYIGSRAYQRDLPPQNIQNQIIRDYCQRHGRRYLLSLTEYAMPHSYLMLHEVLRELDQIDGLVLYSVFMLPADASDRERFVTALLRNNVSLHGAAENLGITTLRDWHRLDDMLCLHYSLHGSSQSPSTAEFALEHHQLS